MYRGFKSLRFLPLTEIRSKVNIPDTFPGLIVNALLFFPITTLTFGLLSSCYYLATFFLPSSYYLPTIFLLSCYLLPSGFLEHTLNVASSYLGRTLDVPSHYFVFTKRIFLIVIILYESLTALRILKNLSKAQKKGFAIRKK